MWTHALTIFSFLLADIASAEAPEYLLGDLDVRLDLPKSRWHMTRWSDFDFEARGESDPVLLFAWATPIRGPTDRPDAWGPLYLSKIEDMKGTDGKITGSSQGEEGGHAFAFVDASFVLANVGRVALRGATTEIDGQNFHFAVVAPARLTSVAERDRATIAHRLEFTAAVPDAGYGSEVEAAGMKTPLPEGWRPLASSELSAVTPRLVKLGLEDLEGCWTAIRPAPGAQPDVMVTCVRPLHLGVVDEYSFETHEATLREKLFGMKEAGGVPVAGVDRMGFLFTPRDGLAFGVLPDSEQVRVTWALGEGPLGDPVRAVLAGSTLPGPHAVTPADRVSYYLNERPFSPVVLCPLGCVCSGVVGVLGVLGLGLGLRARRRPQDEDEIE